MTRRSNRALVRSADLPSSRGRPVRLPALLDEEGNRDRWQSRLADPDSTIVLDLFAGAGGMSHGFENAGFVIGAGLDHDTFACETFAANHLARARQIDLASREGAFDPHQVLEEIGLPRVDVIVGGPPCQGFSQIGLAKVRSLSNEIRDRIYARNLLYREFVRFVGALQPMMFVMENVPHLSGFKDGLIAREIQNDFAEIGYDVYPPMVLDASHFGVPQSRKRLFFVGSRIGRLFERPKPTHGQKQNFRLQTLADAIADLPLVSTPSWDEEIIYSPRKRIDLEALGVWNENYSLLMRQGMHPSESNLVFDHIVRAVREDDAAIFRSMRPGGTYEEVDAAYRRYEIRRDKNGDAHFSDRYFRLSWDRPSITITAHIAKDGYRYIYPENDQIRTLSLREAARIQSFPDHFRFAGYRTNRFVQIGNAVPPLLARAIAIEVAGAIRRYQERSDSDLIERVPSEHPLVQESLRLETVMTP